jgi:methionyl-tRNA formyltransferase
MKIVFLAYREWAFKVFECVRSHPKVENIMLCKTQNELLNIHLEDFDLLISCGWSEELESHILNKIKTIGVHCADLDRYSYGSPIQLQIIDGIIKTKHRIFRLVPRDNISKRSHAHTREYANEVDLFLHGGIQEIFEQLTYTSITLFNCFIDDYPNNRWEMWPEEKVVREQRKPEDSKFTIQQFSQMTTLELYNLIRCLEDPYPNVCIEDDEGILFFKKVSFKRNKNI